MRRQRSKNLEGKAKDRRASSRHAMTFYQWLRHQTEREDDIGELSRYVELDQNFPTEGTTKQFRAYLINHNAGHFASVFVEAWEEWSK